MQKHSTTLKYSISFFIQRLVELDSDCTRASISLCLYNPAWSSHSPALFHFSSSLPPWSQAVNFPSRPLGHDWHDLSRGFSALGGLSRLPPASCYHDHHQTVASCLSPISTWAACVVDLSAYWHLQDKLLCRSVGVCVCVGVRAGLAAF